MPSENPRALELLLEVGRLLSSKLELGELLTSVLELSTKVVDAESASLLLLDEKTQELYFDVALGLGPAASKVRLQMGQGIAGSVAKTRTPELIPDVRKDARWSPAMDDASGFTTRSVLAVPLLLKGRLVGVLEAINKNGGDFSQDDLRVFEAFASQAAVAIDNARLFTSLNEEKFKLATVFSQMADGAVLTDKEGKIILLNAAAKNFLGPEPGAFHGGLKDMTVTPSVGELLGCANGGLDFAAVRKEPTLLVLEGRVTRAPLGDGEGRLFVFRDRTETWRQEKLKRTFLSLISHKLRTPLAAVTGFADILMDEVDEKKDPLTAKAVKTIRAQGGKVSELVDKLLSYTTIESPDATIHPEPFKLDEAVEEAVAAMAEKTAERQAKVDAPKNGITILGDKRLVVEALKNLIDNAIKFNPKHTPAVFIRAEAAGDWAAVTVADTGPGVPPEDLEKVFSRFHQVEKDFTGQQEGMGLGLAFTRKVAQLHGGEATMRSTLGSGAEVSLTLPRQRPPA
ncbi:MAG: ATP-binding protein [Elusimicrobiota bacterium]|nr:MAG: ATP-binding protein [Elusimicrobiota bacterium]